MVVNAADRGRRYWGVLLRGVVLFAAMTVLSVPGKAASTTPLPSASAAPSRQQGLFDPAAAAFSSLLSYSAMSVIAPSIYGAFLSPTQLTFSSGSSAVGPIPMPQSMGLDPAASTMLNNIVQEGLLPGGDSAGAEEFGVGSSGAGISLSGDIVGLSGAGIASSGVVAGVSGGMSSATSAVGTLPTTTSAGGVQPVCIDDQLAKQLHASGAIWNGEGPDASPVSFPPHVFAGTKSKAVNALGDPTVGASGDRSNLVKLGPAGAWCRPAPTPFWQTGPLSSRLFWFPIIVLLVSLIVFWLSRGVKMPTRNGTLVHGA
jgi:hypothetical protein